MVDQLEIPEREELPKLKDLLDEAQETGDVVHIERSSDTDFYARYLYPDKDTDSQVFLLMVLGKYNIPRRKYVAKDALHNAILDYEGATVKLIDVEDIEPDDIRSSMEGKEDVEHPFDSVHVFVKSVDDGRYKDDFRFVREGKEYRFEGYETALEKWRDHDDYIEIGAFGEIRDMDGDEYSFDFKQSGGSIPLDLSAFVDGSPRSLVKEKLGDS